MNSGCKNGCKSMGVVMARFTDVYIKSLKPKAAKYSVRDDSCRGFTLTVSTAGSKVWQYVYHFEGKKRYLNLGHYPATSLADARKKYDTAKTLLDTGVDPTEARDESDDQRRRMPTVDEMFEIYMQRYARKNKKERTWKEDERVFKKDVLPIWGSRKIDGVSKRDVSELLNRIIDRGSPIAANNTFERVRQLFNFSIEQGIIEHSPCDRMKAPAPKSIRARHLSDTEIATVWSTLDAAGMSAEVCRALKLVLLTGQRPGEVIGMHRREIVGGWWTIPAERAKNGNTHRVFLTETAKALIGGATGYIFESPREKAGGDSNLPRPKPIDENALARAVRNNCPTDCTLDPHCCPNESCKADGRECSQKNRLGVVFFRPHDLRRTAATHISSIGFSDEAIDALLNHVKRGVVRHYNLNKYDDEKKAALLAWEEKLLSLIGKARVAA